MTRYDPDPLGPGGPILIFPELLDTRFEGGPWHGHVRPLPTTFDFFTVAGEDKREYVYAREAMPCRSDRDGWVVVLGQALKCRTLPDDKSGHCDGCGQPQKCPVHG